MKLRDYLSFSGIEIANENRTRDYLTSGLFSGVPVISANCGCDATDEGPYSSPSTDTAPWYDSVRTESAQFLGMHAYNITIDSVLARAVTPKILGGATIGRLRPRHRIVAVQGLLLGQSEMAMAYGERWLTSVLAGIIVGCAPDTLRILLACPDDSSEPPFRTLRRVGTVDGPHFGPIGQLPSCYIQEVTFQIAAGIPHLLTDASECLAETVLLGGGN